MATLRITNATRNSVLATHAATRGDCLEEATSEGLFIPESNEIVVSGRSKPFDVLFIDMLKGRIQKAVAGVEASCEVRSQVPAELCAVLALPAGTIELTGSQVGDVIVILSSSHATQEELREIGLLGRPHPA